MPPRRSSPQRPGPLALPPLPAGPVQLGDVLPGELAAALGVLWRFARAEMLRTAVDLHGLAVERDLMTTPEVCQWLKISKRTWRRIVQRRPELLRGGEGAPSLVVLGRTGAPIRRWWRGRLIVELDAAGLVRA